jgi:hypothetical protein
MYEYSYTTRTGIFYLRRLLELDMGRSNVDYKEVELKFLDKDDLLAIELKSKALSIEECLDFLCVTSEEVGEADMAWVKKAWKRGRAVAITTAADKMFSAMSMRGGGQTSMEYLRAMSGTFQVEATPLGKTGDGFSFNVIMPDDK